MRVDLRAIAQKSEHDPKMALLDTLGDYDDIDVFHNLVLLATYIPPEKTAGGIIRPDRSQDEARFQGKAGLVLKLGPLAFQDDDLSRFGGVNVKPLDWVIYRPSDALELFLGCHGNTSKGVPCRLIQDVLIKGRLSDPSRIY